MTTHAAVREAVRAAEDMSFSAAEGMSFRGAVRLSVRGSERLAVAGSERLSVRGSERLAVAGSERLSVRGSERLSVRGSERLSVRGSERLSVRIAPRSFMARIITAVCFFVPMTLGLVAAPSVQAGPGLIERNERYYLPPVSPYHVHPDRLGPLGPADFARPYTDDVLHHVRAMGLLESYGGPDLDRNGEVSRYAFAHLVGAFVRKLHLRVGRIFPTHGEAQDRHNWIGFDRWGHFETCLALSTGLVRVPRVTGFWDKPLTASFVAGCVGRVLARLRTRWPLKRFPLFWPPRNLQGFLVPGHPAWNLFAIPVGCGVMTLPEGNFDPRRPVRGNEVAEIFDRLLTIVDGYRRVALR